MISRTADLAELHGLLRRHRIVALVGARQVGKTTLAKDYLRRRPSGGHFLDLENPQDEARLGDAMLALGPLRGLVVIDEIQRRPDLFPVLRVLADRRPNPARFLLLGSATPELLQRTSESLAGRIYYQELGGLSLADTGMRQSGRRWVRGGLPRSFLARSARESFEVRLGYIRTFLERDLPALGIRTSPSTMRRFWTMLAHYHGQTWNSSELARSFGVADTTVRGYLDRLAAAFAVRLLPPWHANIAKRQVKAPKVYIADSGVFHALLNLPEEADIEAHPKCGASWEGFVIEQIVRRLGARPEECFFWATHTGSELDLLVVRGRRRYSFEIKRTVAPRVTPSMQHALHDLQLVRLDVVYAGDQTFELGPRLRAVALTRLLDDLQPL